MITIRTGTRVARWGRDTGRDVSTVELLVGGLVFTTDANSHEAALELALRTASTLTHEGHAVTAVELTPRQAFGSGGCGCSNGCKSWTCDK